MSAMATIILFIVWACEGKLILTYNISNMLVNPSNRVTVLHCIAVNLFDGVTSMLDILHYITLHYITLHYITLRCVALRCVALRCAALRCAAKRRVSSHRITCVVLCCVVLCCITYVLYIETPVLTLIIQQCQKGVHCTIIAFPALNSSSEDERY